MVTSIGSSARVGLGLALFFAVLASAPTSLAQTSEVLVVTAASESVPPDRLVAVRDAIVAQANTAIPSRTVRAVTSEEHTIIAACQDAACVSAFAASKGGAYVVLTRIQPGEAEGETPGGTVQAMIMDPSTGTPMGSPFSVELPTEGDLATAVSPIAAGIAAGVPTAAPTSSLLIATNVEGAEVLLDDEPIGQSPLARVSTTAGEHQVLVRAAGFNPALRRISVEPGQAARVNVDLDPDESTAAQDAALDEGATAEELAAQEADDSGNSDEGPFFTRWYVIAGAAALVVIGAGIGIGVAASGGEEQTGFPVPPLR